MKRDREKEKLLNAIIYFCQNTKYCYKLKLMKLLYYLDFWHFKETGRSVTGNTYLAWDMGPVPPNVYKELSSNKNDFEEYLFIEEEIYDEINDKKRTIIIPKKEFNEKIFTKRELELVKKISEIFRDAKAKDMTDATHLRNAPWDRTIKNKGVNVEIDYMLALDDEVNSLTPQIVKDKIELDNENRELLDNL
ncbi:Panacea domain-containing protein [Ignavibacterium album]|uniref:Panacea domain-containing protein n=1 Tax=Ignavibacterium album TaxID=591197 RepID=UPI0026EF62BC|nr:Panacea domain-containing protein [Ignavibacterium album]